MNDRRRGVRSVLPQPGIATLRVIQDVEVVRLGCTDAAVITTQTLPVGERVLLEISDERYGASTARLFRAVSSRFVFRDGRLRREVGLSTTAHAPVPDARVSNEPARMPSGPLMAAISRRLPVRLIEVSRSGCLCDSLASLDEGCVGFVDVRTSGRYRSEAVRILRSQRAENTNWPCRIALEFLTLAPLSPESLRGVAAIVATGASPAQTS